MSSISANPVRKTTKNSASKKGKKVVLAGPVTEAISTSVEQETVIVNTEVKKETQQMEWIEEPFTLIKSYFDGQYLERLVRHQIESFNHFTNFQLNRTIEMFNPIIAKSENDFIPQVNKSRLEIQITLENFKLNPPQIHENNGATKLMFPQEARLRNFTYASVMNVDVHIKYIVQEFPTSGSGADTAADAGSTKPIERIIHKILPKINIGKLPIMLKSSICLLTQNKQLEPEQTGECKYDCGGYFIINGSEKTVLSQERAAENRVYCFCGKNTTKWSWYAEIKSVPDFKCISPKQIEVLIANKNNGFGKPIYVNIPRVKIPVDLFVVFRALGVVSDLEICNCIILGAAATTKNLDAKQQCLRELLHASIIESNKYMTQEDAIRHITTYVAFVPINMDKEQGAIKKREFAMEILQTDLFPHCHTTEQKIYFLGYMTNVLLQTSLGWIPPDDRDSYVNKRIELTGTLLNNLFRNYFNKMVKEIQKQTVREINTSSWRNTQDYENIINMINIYKIIKSTTIENGIKRALSTGDFSIKQSNTSKVGVAQVLNRLTYAASLSHLRRINTPMDKSGELIAPRKLHNTTWGFLCLAGDAEVLLSNCAEIKQIRDVDNTYLVNTINRTDLKNEASSIYNCFSKMTNKLYEITTVSGRKIKATGEHPFLVRTFNDSYKMKNVDTLQAFLDFVIISPTAKYIPDITGEDGNFTETSIIKHYSVISEYKKDLESYIDYEFDTKQMKTLARILGTVLTNGFYDFTDGDFFTAVYLNNEEDLDHFQQDVQSFGFSFTYVKVNAPPLETNVFVHSEQKGEGVYEILLEPAFVYMLYLVGLNNLDHAPEWIYNGKKCVKREFVSAVISGLEIKTDLDEPHIVFYKNKMKYSMFHDVRSILIDLNIMSHFIDVDTLYTNNVVQFGDVVQILYNHSLKCKLSTFIEYMRIKKQGVYDISFENFKKGYAVENGCLSVPIYSICEVEPEVVYDFTTSHQNHSFVASSFVVSNCPPETPEGQSIGLVKNLSYMTHITIFSNSSPLYQYAEPYIEKIDEKTTPADLYGKVKVFINGAWIGITERPLEFFQDMKQKKYRGIINIYTSVVFNYKLMEIRICNDAGRLTRPLLRINNGELLVTPEIIEKIESKKMHWNDLLCGNSSVIEYIDPEEQNCGVMCAMKPADLTNPPIAKNIVPPKYTHCEIHPSTIFGVLASCIPFPEHNQAPRNAYQCCMSKQSIGMYATNFDQRMDKTAYVMTYPTRPLVDTRVMNFIKLNEIPSGSQAIVAIMTHTGYNQEDSILINRGSIQRGMFTATIYHTEKDENKKINGDEQIRCKPDPTKTKGMKFGNYSKVNSQGFIPENTLVENRDIIISKILPIKENRNDPTKTVKYEDQSKSYKTTEQTYIDKNYMGRNGDGYNFAKVRVRTWREASIGDKFASRAAQKGTVGNIIPEEDMPFIGNTGLRPDIIINPHSQPSRMTLAQLKETLLSKALVELGLFGDGTAFVGLDIKENICEIVQKCGYESYGNEVMYNGLTGEQIEANIFIGPCFYQRLKHMVNDKVHSRSTGTMVILNRQPTEGRSKGGGLRLGEMERDCLSAGGYSAFLRERFYDAADKFSVHVCKKCGLIAAYNDKYKVHLCKTCENRTDFSYVEIPYSFKLLSQELQTINVVPRLITE